MAAMIHLLWLVLMLSWSLEGVNSQSLPYISFRGQTLANHSYVDLSLVGDGSGSVQCHTDLSTCCSGTEGPHRGDWFFPNGSRLGFPFYNDIYEWRRDQRVDLSRRNNAHTLVGIYRCSISTNAVQDDCDISVRDTVYVGLYTASRGMFSATMHNSSIIECGCIHHLALKFSRCVILSHHLSVHL